MRRPSAFVAPSLRTRFWILIAAFVVPAVALACWLIFETYRHERRAVERQLIETSRAVSALVDAELRARIATLRGLAMSRALRDGDFARFEGLARRADLRPEESIVLLDVDGRELASAAEPDRTEQPHVVITPEVARTLAMGRAYVSNLTPAGPGRAQGVFIAISVTLRGNRRGTLCAVITAGALSQSLLENRLMHRGVVTIIDRDWTVVARSRRHAASVGKKATPDVQAAARDRNESALDSVTLDGDRSVAAVQVSPETGWAVVVAGHKAELLEPAMRMRTVALVVTATVGVLVLGLAVWFGLATRAVVEGLVHDTQTLARGEPVAARRTGVREADTVSEALAKTSRELDARQTALLEARDAALSASRAKDEFLAALSHELRTPLNPVLLLASDAAIDPAHPAEVRELFTTIEKNVIQEVRLIDDLLDLTRIVAGKFSLRNDPVVFDAAVRESLEIVRPRVAEKRLRVQVALNADGVNLRGDAVRLQQVLTNVLGNAVKFTPDEGTLEVRTRMDWSTGGVQLEVTDSGIGMTAAEIARVFDRFAQGDHARKAGQSRYGGLGLGLTISRSLVEAHGGRIEATSPGPGLGSTFLIWLPVMKPEGPSVPMAE